MRRLVKISVLLSALVCFPHDARCGSPYAANGLGTIIPDDVGRSRSLGSAGIALGDGVNMMRGNPALPATFSNHSYSISMLYDRTKTFTGGSDQPTYAKTKPILVLPIRKRS